MIENEKFKLTLFLIYTIIYEVLIWGLTSASIYFLNCSFWIIIVGMIMSNAQLKPKHFGLKYKIEEE